LGHAATAAGAAGVVVIAGRAVRKFRFGASASTASEGVAQAASQSTPVHDDLPPQVDAEVRAFLGPIRPGLRLGTWTIAATYGLHRGALPFVLRDDRGQRMQVDLMARDAASPPGVAFTERGQLYVINSGRGDTFTPNHVVDTVQRLARLLRERERQHALPLDGFARRHQRYPDGIFVVPV